MELMARGQAMLTRVARLRVQFEIVKLSARGSDTSTTPTAPCRLYLGHDTNSLSHMLSPTTTGT